ncbi:SDR family oxidoreductase [Nocardioides sp. 616]|uniref:SDR family NAD(P)-dependent oxidoreductase n=1 Tax=Nocardioides sp. 616 TaxID=2268090 RepID=UPI000CE3AE60|nr:SDR family oxidoreductase [Nocardioides sp. 616]
MAVTPEPRLLDEVVVVTGAARGLGAAIARAAAEAGAHVLVGDLHKSAVDSAVDELVSDGLSARGTVLDVTDAASVDAALRTVLDWQGRVTGVVNNAGRLIEADVVTLTEDEWDAVMDVNLKGAWRMCRAFIPAMLEAGGGAIVNISSLEGLVARPRHVAYAVSKAGMLNLTRAVAVDFGRQGIRCNAICPGSIETALLTQHLEATGDPEAAAADLVGRNYVGRLGRPDEVGATALFLLSREAGFINGSHIVIDGARGATT